MKKNYGMTESDAVAYKVKTREILYLGDAVSFCGKKYIVGEVERKWEGNEVYNYYMLETVGELRQIPYDNKKIIVFSQFTSLLNKFIKGNGYSSKKGYGKSNAT